MGGRRPNYYLELLPAFDPVALDFTPDQRARGGRDDGACRPFALCVDRTADECSAGASDNQADGAVGTLTAILAIRILPDVAFIAARFGLIDGWKYRNGQACGRHGQNNLTHQKHPLFSCRVAGRYEHL